MQAQQQHMIRENRPPSKMLARLKRERPTELEYARKSPNPLTVSNSITGNYSSPTQPPEAKRSRIAVGFNGLEAGKPPRFSSRNPIAVLEECLKSGEAGDRQNALLRLREFSNDHLAVLESSSHVQCISLLLRIAAISKFAETSRTCLRYCLSILERSPVKSDAWQTVSALLTDSSKKEQGLCHRAALSSSILALFEFAVRTGQLCDDEAVIASKLALQSIHSCDHNQRIVAVQYLVTKVIKDSPRSVTTAYARLEKILCDLTRDRDARVRVAAVWGLSLMSESTCSLSFYLYPAVKELCQDPEKRVRIKALHIVKSFADRMPELEVKGRNDARLRLVDDAFTVVCHAVNDTEVSVRAEAATLLGTFAQVSDPFLDQTLDKKLLNAMRMSEARGRDNASRRPHRFEERRERHATSSVWSTGKKLGEDVPVERPDEEKNSIFPTGACGAFVAALEDEFKVVRQAGVYSLGRLAADRPFLAAAAVEHLADMFNDEIEQVRLDAIHALTPLVIHGVLQKEQLDTIFTVLDDALPDSREALRILLSKATLGTPECIRYSVKVLLRCMRRFPIDRQSVFMCLSCLGRRHASFVQPLVDELLGLDPVFDITEPTLEDYPYLAKLILILNAASIHSPICSLLPAFAVRHYRYLRCSMPHLVPSISAFSENCFESRSTIGKEAEKETAGQRSRVRILLSKSYEKLQEAYEGVPRKQRDILQRRIIADVEAVSELDEKVAGSAQFLSSILRVFSHCDLAQQMLSSGGDFVVALHIIEEGLTGADRTETEFGFIDETMLSIIAECRFRLRIFRTAVQIDLSPGSYSNIPQVLEAELAAFKSRLSCLGTVPSPSVLNAVEKITEQLETADTKKLFGGRSLVSFFGSSGPVLPRKFSSLGRIAVKYAQIVEPTDEQTEMKFIAGLPMGIPFNVLLHNFEESDTEKFRFEVEYPDQTYSVFRPRKAEFKYIGPQKFRLLCNVLVQASAWSDAALVRVSCVLKAPECSSVPLRSDVSSLADDTGLDIRSRFVPLLESPFSNKQAAIEVPIHPQKQLGNL